MIGWIAILIVIIVILILRLIVIVDITEIASGYSKACPKKRCEIIKKIVAKHQKSPQRTAAPEPALRGPDEIFSDQKLVADKYNFTRTIFEELPIAIFEYKDLESDTDWGVDNYPAIMDSKTYYQKNNGVAHDVLVPNGLQFMSVHEMQPVEINDPEWTIV